MNNLVLALLVTGSLLSTASTWAGKSDQMIIAEAAQNSVSVAEAKQLSDETAVTLSGVIVRKMHEDHFELQDSSGVITLEVDRELWRPMNLKKGDQVKVIGEVDTHNGQPADIDVVKIGRKATLADQWSWYNQY